MFVANLLQNIFSFFMKKSNTITFVLVLNNFLKVVFNNCRKVLLRLLISISFSINPLFLFILSEKVNAQTIKLTCNVKSHFKLYKSENWVNNDFQWDLEINQKNQTIVRKQKVFYEGKNYDIDFYYSIKNQNDNFIIAIEDKETSIYGGPYISGITLDLNSKKMTGVNTINDNQGISFTNYYGNCVYKY